MRALAAILMLAAPIAVIELLADLGLRAMLRPRRWLPAATSGAAALLKEASPFIALVAICCMPLFLIYLAGLSIAQRLSAGLCLEER